MTPTNARHGDGTRRRGAPRRDGGEDVRVQMIELVNAGRTDELERLLEAHPELRLLLDAMLRARRGPVRKGKAPTALEAYAQAGMTRYVVSRLEAGLEKGQTVANQLADRVGELQRQCMQLSQRLGQLENAWPTRRMPVFGPNLLADLSEETHVIDEKALGRIAQALLHHGQIALEGLRREAGVPRVVLGVVLCEFHSKRWVSVDNLSNAKVLGAGHEPLRKLARKDRSLTRMLKTGLANAKSCNLFPFLNAGGLSPAPPRGNED